MKTDDPKFTAYCLGELDPAECAEIETLLRDDPEMAAEIEATKVFAAQLRAELVNEQEEGLDAARRANVMRAVERAPEIAAASSPHAGSRWGTWMLRMAAVLALLGLVAGVFFAPKPQRNNESVSRNIVMRETMHPTDGSSSSRSDFVLADTDPSARLAGIDTLAKAPAKDEFGESLGRVVPGQKEQEQPIREEKPMLLAQLEAQKNILDAYVVPGGDASGVRTRDNPIPESTTLDKAATNDLAMIAPAARPAAAPAAPAAVAPVPTTLASETVALGTVNAPQPTGDARGGRAVTLQRDAKKTSDNVTKLSAIADNEGLVLRQKVASPKPAAPEGEVTTATRRSLFGNAVTASSNITDLDSGTAGRGRLASSSDEARKQLEELDASKRGWFYKREDSTARFRIQSDPSNTEAYDAVTDNPFMEVRAHPVSTFSIDVDSASYANVRRFLNAGQRPPKGAVRIEELLNYFSYDYPQPNGDQAFSATLEAGPCPWKPEHRLVRVGLKGREIKRDQRPATNLVFLVDVSGSMQPANKLPLVKESLRLLVDQLTAEDRVSMAVYAGASGCVLEPTSDKAAMRAALDKLEAGGSTNGASGIQLAYDLAQKAFIKGGVNRVILATDGDFNVGVTSQSALIELIENKAKSGVFLSVLGFGMGNLKDSTLEKLADKGNGNYAYIDTLNEGRKVLVEQMSGTLVTIAKDVKIQVEFNPAQVTAYRLIGYENRLLAKEDFNDDTKDAGEIGAGHSVTAMYEVVPSGQAAPAPNRAVDPLKYQTPPPAPAAQAAVAGAISREMLTLKLRHKLPDGDKSQLLELPLVDEGAVREKTSRDFRFAAAVASFGMLLRDSPHKGSANWDATMELAVEGKGDDASGYRGEFISLIGKAKALEPQAGRGDVSAEQSPAR